MSGCADDAPEPGLPPESLEARDAFLRPSVSHHRAFRRRAVSAGIECIAAGKSDLDMLYSFALPAHRIKGMETGVGIHHSHRYPFLCLPGHGFLLDCSRDDPERCSFRPVFPAFVFSLSVSLAALWRQLLLPAILGGYVGEAVLSRGAYRNGGVPSAVRPWGHPMVCAVPTGP